MAVRKLRAKQRGPFCSFGCSLRAVHRGLGFTKFACEQHKPALELLDAEQVQRERNQEGDGF